MPLSSSYFPNYYSIDDILATQERATCKFLQNVPKLGKLNPVAEEPDLEAGTTLELPMWLALDISSGQHPIVLPELPKVYKESYREILKADACAVDLHKFGMYFYEFGSYCRRFDHRGEVSEILVNTFISRFRQLVMVLANNTISDPTVVDRLDMLERSIFRSAHKATDKLTLWLKKSEMPLKAADMVVNYKKRKRVEVEELL